MNYTVPAQPKQVRLEITNKCNAHCITCHRSTMTRDLGNMSWELLDKCLNDIRQFPEPLFEVVPSNYGETFMAEQWKEKLQLIAKRLPNTRMVIPTNGTLLTDGYVGELCHIPTLKLVNLSINAFLPETYEFFHKLPAKNLETIKRAAIRIRELRPDITLWMSMVLDSQIQSPKEVDLFIEKWSVIGIPQINPAQYNNRPDRTPIVPVKLPCRSLFSDLVINYDGRATSCCFDSDCQLIIGDSTKSLLDIWHSKEFSELRNRHLQGKREMIPLCRSCTYA